MLDTAKLIPDDFLASKADLIGVLVHFAESDRRRSGEHRRDRRLLETALSNVLLEAPTINPLLNPSPNPSPDRSPEPSPPPNASVDEPVSASRRDAEAKGGRPHRRGNQYCQCGHCKWCLDNARWDRIYSEKFADPSYYGHIVIRQNSTLAEAR
jgi:hypothetical protein